jgi:hypothetical protein
MNRININGVQIDVPSGSKVSCSNGVITVNGAPYDGKSGKASGIVKIELHGNPCSITSDESVDVHGNVLGNVDAGGSVKCQSVGGEVDAGGSITCGDVQGDADAGGSIACGNVGGDVDAGGSVVVKG